MQLYEVITSGTTHTNSTDEAALATLTFPANFWQVGKVVKFSGAAKVADTNSTDTLTCLLRLGAAALTGTAVYTSAAVDVADNDVIGIEATIICTAVGSAGSFVCSVIGCNPDATGEAADIEVTSVTSIDTEAATYLAMTGDWSVAHADNQVAILAAAAFEAA